MFRVFRNTNLNPSEFYAETKNIDFIEHINIFKKNSIRQFHLNKILIYSMTFSLAEH